MYLNQKVTDEYTGQESYVHAKLQQHDVTFFPLNKSIDLENLTLPLHHQPLTSHHSTLDPLRKSESMQQPQVVIKGPEETPVRVSVPEPSRQESGMSRSMSFFPPPGFGRELSFGGNITRATSFYTNPVSPLLDGSDGPYVVCWVLGGMRAAGRGACPCLNGGGGGQFSQYCSHPPTVFFQLQLQRQ